MLAIAIFVLCLLASLCYFCTGLWAFQAFRSAGATPFQAFNVAEGECNRGAFVLAAGLLHWALPRFRLPFAVAGVFVGFYGAYFLLKNANQLIGWDILHGDVLALGNWSEVIFVTLGILCAIELVLTVRKSR
jgi:hypothetical protein